MTKGNDSTERKRREHVEEMKKKIIELTGDPGCLYLQGLTSLEMQEKFLERILFIEGQEEEPLFGQLESKNILLPPPEELNDADLHAKLWEVIHEMARIGYFISSTDHLSDRQLYALLWSDILRQPMSANPDPLNVSCHIDILGGCSDEDLMIRLKYYADEDERTCWEGDFPDDEIPPREPLPYDRDRHLPVPQDSCLCQ